VPGFTASWSNKTRATGSVFQTLHGGFWFGR
jgi:hypothetical protein